MSLDFREISFIVVVFLAARWSCAASIATGGASSRCRYGGASGGPAVSSIVTNKANWRDRGRDCGLRISDCGFEDARAGRSGRAAYSSVTNKANFRRFWAENEGGAEKQSQTKPIFAAGGRDCGLRIAGFGLRIRGRGGRAVVDRWQVLTVVSFQIHSGVSKYRRVLMRKCSLKICHYDSNEIN